MCVVPKSLVHARGVHAFVALYLLCISVWSAGLCGVCMMHVNDPVVHKHAVSYKDKYWLISSERLLFPQDASCFQ